MTEAAIIALIKKYFPNPPDFKLTDSLTIGDDACWFFPDANSKIVISTDSVIENTHFDFRYTNPEDIAVKLFQKTVSDLIVKQAKPAFLLLNLNINPTFAKPASIHSFLKTLARQCQKYQVKLIGGDCARSQVCNFSMTAIGICDRFLSRQNITIRPGDKVYRLGQSGQSYLGLLFLQNFLQLKSKSSFPILKKLQKAHLQPQAQWDFPLLWKTVAVSAKAAMDQSDSLWETITTLAMVNACEIHMDLALFPSDPYLKKGLALWKSLPKKKKVLNFFPESLDQTLDLPAEKIFQLFGAEDHAIVFIAAEIEKNELTAWNKQKKARLDEIGTINKIEKKGKSKTGIHVSWRGEAIDKYIKKASELNLYQHFN